MKKFIMTLTAAALLSSCAWQDKGFVGPSGGDDKVMSVEQAEAKEVSALYEGYEELQGKQLGEHIIMPEVITPQEIDKVYIFNREDNYDKTNIEERGTEFFKSFFGDKFNADRLYYYSYEDDPNTDPDLSYNSNSPDLPEGICDPDDPDYGSFNGYPCIAQKAAHWNYWPQPENVIAEYDPVKDKDTVMKLDDGECTVGEACQTIMDFLDREFKGFEGIEPVIKRVSYYSDEEDDQPVFRAHVYCVLMREGIPLFDGPSGYWYEEPTEEGKMYIQYIMIDYTFNLGGKDNILTIACGPGPQKATSIKEVDNLIPLKTAAQLLDENLAEKLLFRIDDVRLCYCQKLTTYSYGVLMDDGVIWYDNSKAKYIYHEYRPTWVFYFADNRATLLVDAITGEITIAASQGILYDMRAEQLK